MKFGAPFTVILFEGVGCQNRVCVRVSEGLVPQIPVKRDRTVRIVLYSSQAHGQMYQRHMEEKLQISYRSL
jgi:hypothetical protein